jgi:hypothetical protein
MDKNVALVFAHELRTGPGLLDLNLVDGNRYARFFRNAQKYSPIAEGELAAKCSEKMFMPDWAPMVEWFVKKNFVDLTPAGRGRAMIVSLTENGTQFAVELFGEAAQPAKPTEAVTE